MHRFMMGNSTRLRLLRAVGYTAALASAPVVLGAHAALACTCLEMPSYVAVARADAVFEGRVVAIQTPDPTGKVRSSSDQVIVTLEATSVWKGAVRAEVKIGTAATGASCGFTFDDGSSYIVCAYTTDGGLETSLCSGTAATENAGTLRRTLGRLEARGGADMNDEAMALPIVDALTHGDGEERADAAESLAHLDIDPRPLMSTLTALVDGDDPDARAAAVAAISAAELRVMRGEGGISPVPPLVDTSFYVRALSDPSDDVRVAACAALTRPHHAAHAARSDLAVDALIEAASGSSRELRALAVRAMAAMDPPPAATRPVLRGALGESTSELRRAGALGLARMGPHGVAALQGEVLADTANRELAMDIFEVLGRVAHVSDPAFATLSALAVAGHPASRADALVKLASTRPASPTASALVEAASADSSEIVRAGAATAARQLDADGQWKVELLSTLLDDDALAVRLQSIRALGAMGEQAIVVVPALLDRLNTSQGREAQQIRAAIKRIAPHRDISEAPPGR